MGDLSKELQNEIEKLEPDEAHALGQIMRALKDGDRSKLRTFLEPDYLEQPVSIERFLDDERYLGRPLWDFEKHRSKIYPYWREKLKMVFESESIHEIIATGPGRCFGLHSSFGHPVSEGSVRVLQPSSRAAHLYPLLFAVKGSIECRSVSRLL